jgi:hypothetical protein
MSTTSTAPAVDIRQSDPVTVDTPAPPRVWRVGIVAGVVASVATMVVAVLADAAGVSLEIAGETIPYIGFANLTMIGAVIGIALAAVLARRARQPRSTFVRITVALTVFSLVPDVIADAEIATRMVLGFTHVVAAAVIVPAIARRLAA